MLKFRKQLTDACKHWRTRTCWWRQNSARYNNILNWFQWNEIPTAFQIGHPEMERYKQTNKHTICVLRKASRSKNIKNNRSFLYMQNCDIKNDLFPTDIPTTLMFIINKLVWNKICLPQKKLDIRKSHHQSNCMPNTSRFCDTINTVYKVWISRAQSDTHLRGRRVYMWSWSRETTILRPRW